MQAETVKTAALPALTNRGKKSALKGIILELSGNNPALAFMNLQAADQLAARVYGRDRAILTPADAERYLADNALPPGVHPVMNNQYAAPLRRLGYRTLRGMLQAKAGLCFRSH